MKDVVERRSWRAERGQKKAETVQVFCMEVRNRQIISACLNLVEVGPSTPRVFCPIGPAKAAQRQKLLVAVRDRPRRSCPPFLHCSPILPELPSANEVAPPRPYSMGRGRGRRSVLSEVPCGLSAAETPGPSPRPHFTFPPPHSPPAGRVLHFEAGNAARMGTAPLPRRHNVMGKRADSNCGMGGRWRICPVDARNSHARQAE